MEANFEEDFPQFKDVTKDTQLINSISKNITKTVNSQTSSDNIEDYWYHRGKSYLNYYNKGKYYGSANNSSTEVKDLLYRFFKVFEDTIREELKAKDVTSENFQSHFLIIKNVFNLLIQEMKTNKMDLDSERFLALLQGFINNFVRSTK